MTLIVEEEYLKLLLGFLVGALIGLERQAVEVRAERRGGVQEWRPGVRTSGLFSLLGTTAIIVYSISPLKELVIIMVVFAVSFVIAIIIAYTIMRFIRNPQEMGITTSMALALAFISGILVGLGEIILAITISVFVTFILAIKRSTERLLMNVEYIEIASALQIGILWLLILPLIPDITVFHINIRVLFTFMLLILALSFISYLTIKNLGPTRGLIAFTVIGGLVSSEATVSNIIRMVNELKELSDTEREIIGSAGVLLANSVMIIRTLAITALLLLSSINALVTLTMTLLPAFVIGFLLASYRLNRVKIRVFPRMEIENPLSYKMAAKFTGLFIIIAFTSALFQSILEDVGLYLTGFFGGLVSILAVSITVASLYLTGTITLDVAIKTITIGTVAAVINKIIYTRDAPKYMKRGIYPDIALLSITLIVSALLCSKVI